MLENIKNNLFTIHGVATTLVHLMIIIGVLVSYAFVHVMVLGNGLPSGLPQSMASRR